MPADTDAAARVNDPTVLAELQQAFAAYEDALLRNDVEALNAFFWNDARVLRYGIAEHGRGFESLCAYRRGAAAVHPERRLRGTVLVTFGAHSGSACTEFTCPGSARVGRQTQTWVRFAEGWRIVAAHVSEIDADRLDA